MDWDILQRFSEGKNNVQITMDVPAPKQPYAGPSIMCYTFLHNTISPVNRQGFIMLQQKKNLISNEIRFLGGDKRDRTADLLNAMFACREHDA